MAADSAKITIAPVGTTATGKMKTSEFRDFDIAACVIHLEYRTRVCVCVRVV